MNNSYSQLTAFKALLKASLQSILKSPSALAFSIAFPLVFIFAFTFIENKNSVVYTFAIVQTNTNNEQFKAIEKSAHIKFVFESDTSIINDKLKHDKWTGFLSINEKDTLHPLSIRYSPNAFANKEVIESLLNSVLKNDQTNNSVGSITNEYKPIKSIDFILPGQLGFAILAASVFGTAFLFYNLRSTLVLKRFFTTPINKLNIILAECTARIIVQLGASIFIIFIGYYFLDFTLLHGVVSFVNIVMLCLIGLFTFMSYGFIISGIAKSESLIPPLANIVTLPQFILAGTFFPIENLPKWIQIISNILPLTHFNNALRLVANEGYNLWEVKTEIIILLAWGILSYFIANKTFKWTP